MTYPSPTDAEHQLWSWFGRARTPQEVLGRIVQALVAAGCADESCRPQSHRTRYVLPGTYGGGTVAEIPVLVDRLAEPHLPPRLAEQARERAARRTRYAEELDEVDRAAPDADAEDVAIPDLAAGEAAPEEADVA